MPLTQTARIAVPEIGHGRMPKPSHSDYTMTEWDHKTRGKNTSQTVRLGGPREISWRQNSHPLQGQASRSQHVSTKHDSRDEEHSH